jgi:cobalamin biosynthesis protein CobD/CbiB
VNSYRGVIEDRHTLGTGREPTTEDIESAAHLARLIGHSAVGSLLLT